MDIHRIWCCAATKFARNFIHGDCTVSDHIRSLRWSLVTVFAIQWPSLLGCVMLFAYRRRESLLCLPLIILNQVLPAIAECQFPSGEDLRRDCFCNIAGKPFQGIVHKSKNFPDARCCKLLNCPPGKEYVMCREGRPNSGTCRSCDFGYFSPSTTNSTQRRSCFQHSRCEGPGILTKFAGSHISDVICGCDTSAGYYISEYEDDARQSASTCTQKSCDPGQSLSENGSCRESEPYTESESSSVPATTEASDDYGGDENNGLPKWAIGLIAVAIIAIPAIAIGVWYCKRTARRREQGRNPGTGGENYPLARGHTSNAGDLENGQVSGGGSRVANGSRQLVMNGSAIGSGGAESGEGRSERSSSFGSLSGVTGSDRPGPDSGGAGSEERLSETCPSLGSFRGVTGSDRPVPDSGNSCGNPRPGEMEGPFNLLADGEQPGNEGGH